MARLTINRGTSVREISARTESDGGVTVLADNHPILVLTSKGALRRLRNLPRTLGFRLLDDGRIAIPKKRARMASRY